MNRLWLIGTGHPDIDGARRLEALLDFIRPDAITVEVDAQRAANIDRLYQHSIPRLKADSAAQEKYLSEHEANGNNLETIRMLYLPEKIGSGYEYMVPKTLWEPRGIPVFLVDAQRNEERFSQVLANYPHLTPHVESLDSAKLPLEFMLSPTELREFILKTYMTDTTEQLDKLVADGLKKKLEADEWQTFVSAMSALQQAYTDFFVLSDAHVEQKLRELLPKYSTVSHIGGHGHLVTYRFGQKNLYERLIDLNPRKVRLSYADSLPNTSAAQ